MNILYVLDKPNLYGSERHVQKLIESFSGKHNIHLLTFQNGPLLDLVAIDKFLLEFTWFDVFNLKKIKLIIDFIRKNKIQLIHAHQPKAIFIMSIIGYLSKIKTIVTIHSLPITNAQSHSNKVISVLVFVGHYFIKCVSEFFANRVVYLSLSSFNLSFFQYKSIVIPNWVDIDSTLEFNEHKSLDPIRFLFVGTVSFNKGFDRLLLALEEFSIKKWELHVVGGIDPLFERQLNLLLEKFPYKEQIIFHGFHDNVDPYFKMANIFILLSRFETFGLVYVEAMKFGLPVIAWDICVINEIIPKSNLILKSIIDLNKISETNLLSHENLKNLFYININHVKENFSRDKIIPIYQQLYSQTLYEKNSYITS